jgi:hypothetical protein
MVGKDKEEKPETYVGTDRYGNLQVRKLRKDSWTMSDKAAFLDHLAVTCNVKASCAAIGKAENVAHAMHRRDPAFAEAWGHALHSGYATLEAMLIERARGSIPIPIGETKVTIDPGQMDTELALKLIDRHLKRLQGGAHKGMQPYKRVTEDKTNAALLKRLKALHRRLQKEAGNDSMGLGGN